MFIPTFSSARVFIRQRVTVSGAERTNNPATSMKTVAKREPAPRSFSGEVVGALGGLDGHLLWQHAEDPHGKGRLTRRENPAGVRRQIALMIRKL